MEGRTLDRIGLFVALGGAALTLIAFVLGDASLGFGALVGAVTALSNWLVVRWLGKQIVIYCDPNVMFGTVVKGGIRLRGVKRRTAPAPVPVVAPPANYNVESCKIGRVKTGTDGRV